jgi:hypothetical protein
MLICMAAGLLQAQQAGQRGHGRARRPAATAERTPELVTILRRIREVTLANRARSRPYVVTRNYRLFGGNAQRPDSEVIAEISFVPPATKTYTIQKASGSERGENVVRRILNKETEMAGDDSSHLTLENYDFAFLGRETLNGRPCFVLGLTPKRKSTELVLGNAWVDAETYQIHRIQGKPAKNPSWWLKEVELTLEFGEVDGMWLHNATEAVAEVRLFGRRTLVSRSLDYQTAREVAANAPAAASVSATVPPAGILPAPAQAVRAAPRKPKAARRPTRPVPPLAFGTGANQP